MALVEIKIKANYYNHNINNNYKFLANDSKNSKHPIYMITGCIGVKIVIQYFSYISWKRKYLYVQKLRK